MKMQQIVLAQMITFVLAGALASAQSRHLPPADPKACFVSQPDFNGWFVGGSVGEKPGGSVRPADSIGFSDDTNCDFYKWSAQMFLWLTSKSTAYSGTGFVFDSDVFFDVSPSVCTPLGCDPSKLGCSCERTLIPNTEPNFFQLRSAKPEKIGETGQAEGSGVLISQKGSLLYYGIHVNEMYAYFLTRQKACIKKNPEEKTLCLTKFPTDITAIAELELYADRSFTNEEALFLELKTSWVDASTLGDRSCKYITIEASVPKYDRKNKKRWTVPKKNETKTETITLALVGMHIVGIVQNHPEMIWATYEHVDNSPDNSYCYYTKSEKKRVPYNSKVGTWLLMERGGTKSGANLEYASVKSSGDIEVIRDDYTIKPSNTYRFFPWGSEPAKPSDISRAPDRKTSLIIKNNTLLISINNSVWGSLADGDVRKNYVLIGAIWTQKGKIPPLGTPKGSLNLLNSTMETFHQKPNYSCFSCHQGKTSLDLSHIYGEIGPLKK